MRQIVFVDDELRRTFFSQIQVQSVVPSQVNLEKIRIEQRVAKGNRRIAAVGPIIRVTPFDEWGRRIFTMNTSGGAIDVIQGITEVTPVYTKVEGLAARSSYVWDMRIATSSIPRDTLSKILLKAIDPKDADQRLRLVRLYIQAERYSDARAELQSVIAEFPDLADLKKQVTALYQVGAKRMIQEIELRKKSGQHQLASSMLERFPVRGRRGRTAAAGPRYAGGIPEIPRSRSNERWPRWRRTRPKSRTPRPRRRRADPAGDQGRTEYRRPSIAWRITCGWRAMRR